MIGIGEASTGYVVGLQGFRAVRVWVWGLIIRFTGFKPCNKIWVEEMTGPCSLLSGGLFDFRFSADFMYRFTAPV